ncbi:putative inactive receptor kinase-like [Dorcoceras hygrometricum]|uniref:Putative inactive receptor kinase-like n=1 Tax=Dorcoceras hygrometricum TaxID=472368 RepID=A0A2Z7CY64_9LAMI|nr:putative inactive receptor kinase-like [Dorcoceras hygrometricum]
MKLGFQTVANLLLLLAISAVASSDLNSDRRALLEFAASVPHARKLYWNSSNPICTSWIGITCSKDGTRVIGIHLPGVGLYGSIPEKTIGNLDALRVISLHTNFLNGNLPSDVLSILSLRSVYLQKNNFSGGIPLYLSPRLSVIDLSSNSLSGTIPNLDLPRLRLLNLSFNSFDGPIPSALEKFPVSSFVGNSHLCGPPLPYCSGLSPAPAPVPLPKPKNSSSPEMFGRQRAVSSRKLGTGAIVAIVIGGSSLLILLLLVLLLRYMKKKSNSGGTRVIKTKASSIAKAENLKSEDFGSGVQEAEKNKLVFFQRCSYTFDLEDLLRASAEVLGKGSYGTAYKAILDESTTVVVKRLREVGFGKKEFEQHLETLNGLGIHPNVMPLLAYYYSKDEKLLVYEYMPAGSLCAALHGHRGTGRTPLDWDTRLNIALGAARGLAHIHSEGGTRFTHANIKSSNILLTDGLEACVTDFSLGPLFPSIPTKYRVAGYRAPEVIEAQKTSQKSDVYSFGVLLLEILTGKSPIQYVGYDEVIDLPRWVRSVVREEWTAEVFDSELLKYQNIEEEMVQLLQIALSCVAKGVDMRPSIDDVMRMIEEIRGSEGDNRPSSEDNRSKDSNVQTP